MYPTIAEILTLAYPVPNDQSEEQADRLAGKDLPSETDDSLRRELTVLRFLNYFTDSPWHQSREESVANEMAYRRTRRRLARNSDKVERAS